MGRKNIVKKFQKASHKGSFKIKKNFLVLKFAGLFLLRIYFFQFERIEWIKERDRMNSQCCPKCGIDSVLSEKYPILDKTFLLEMNKLWF